ncbi:MAG: YolD-like family protein [bacterium]
MSQLARAAQFSPFAALKGYEEAVAEKARLTQKRPVLSEEAKQEINYLLVKSLAMHQRLTITYFEPDPLKEGGRLISVTGEIKKYDDYHQLITVNHDIINIDDIIHVILADEPSKT